MNGSDYLLTVNKSVNTCIKHRDCDPRIPQTPYYEIIGTNNRHSVILFGKLGKRIMNA
jgi:hypothetical protein